MVIPVAHHQARYWLHKHDSTTEVCKVVKHLIFGTWCALYLWFDGIDKCLVSKSSVGGDIIASFPAISITNMSN